MGWFDHKVDFYTGVDENGNLTTTSGTVYGMDNSSSARTTNATNAFNFQAQQFLQAQQNAYNTEMWERENEYNTPAAQRQRMIEAGMNPLYYNGSMSNGNATSSPISASPAFQAQSPSLNPFFGDQIQGLQGINSAIGNLLESKKVAIADKKADAEISRLNTQNEESRATISKISSSIGVDTATASKLYSDIEVNNSAIQMNYANVEKMTHEGKLAYERAVTEQLGRDLSFDKIRSSIALDNANVAKRSEEIKEIQQHVELMVKEALLKGVQIDIANLEYIERDIKNVYVAANEQAAYERNKAEIQKALWGAITPAISYAKDLVSPDEKDGINSRALFGDSNREVFPGSSGSPSYVRAMNEQ